MSVPNFHILFSYSNSHQSAKMPRQVLELSDYFAPLAALIMFALAVLVFSFFVINFFYITDRDDLTIFEKFGAHLHLCLGPHAMSDIYRGGPRTYALPQEHNAAELDEQNEPTNGSTTRTMTKEQKF